MTTLAQGTYKFYVGIEYKDELRGFSPDAFAMRMHDLTIAAFSRSTVLAPNIRLNPAAQTWRSRYIVPTLWILRTAFVIVTRGTTTGAIADVVARSFREAGAGSEVDAAELAAKLDAGDHLPFSWFTGPFGHVSMRWERVASAPPSIEPEPIDSVTVERWQHATVLQGERVEVPPPVQPGSSTPAPPLTAPPAATQQPYGGTPEEPVLPDDPPPQGPPIPSSAWVLPAFAAAALLLATLAIVVPSQPAAPPPQLPPPTPQLPSRRGRR